MGDNYENGVSFELGEVIIEEDGLDISIAHVVVLVYVFLALR